MKLTVNGQTFLSLNKSGNHEVSFRNRKSHFVLNCFHILRFETIEVQIVKTSKDDLESFQLDQHTF